MEKTKLSAEERLAARQAREQMLINNIDRAIGMAPKLSHPPVYDDYSDLLSFWQVVETVRVRQSAQVRAQVRYQKEVNVARKRR